jgi:phage terminase large subunit-like protein
MLMFGMRLGADPRTVVTTTPRPAKLIRDLGARPDLRRDPRLELPKSRQLGAGIFRSDHRCQ